MTNIQKTALKEVSMELQNMPHCEFVKVFNNTEPLPEIIEHINAVKGKAYANRKSADKRPESDFYATPGYLVSKLNEVIRETYSDAAVNLCDSFSNPFEVLEPAEGNGVITNKLNGWRLKKGFVQCNVTSHDIRTDGVDFLDYKPEKRFSMVITNPPFSLFDNFVKKAKETAPIVIMIGKMNFFGAYRRAETWEHLKHVYVFNRQVDYRSPERDDGKFYCGNLVTGWFVWDMSWTNSWWKQSILNVQNGVLHRGRYKIIYKENE